MPSLFFHQLDHRSIPGSTIHCFHSRLIEHAGASISATTRIRLCQMRVVEAPTAESLWTSGITIFIFW